MDVFTRLLQQHGMKATSQRMAVHTAMMDLVHASADMVYESIVKRGGCRISKASVYSILTELADNGIYARRMSANNKMFFDINTYRHVHLYDSVNHEFLDIEADELLDAVETGLRRRRFKGFKMDDVDVQIICHPTRKRLI